MHLIQVFALFAIGYIIRPLGGFILGHFGDKYGRKKVFVFSVCLMGISTTLMGLLPTYQQVGMLAPALLLVVRMLQGFALGGELPGSITFVYEHTKKYKGFATGFLFLFVNIGLIIGQLMHAILISTLSLSELTTFGWRIAFIFGGLLALASYFVQRNLDETPAYKESHNHVKFPVATLLTKNYIGVMAGTMVVCIGAMIVSMMYLFMSGYMTAVHFFSLGRIIYLVLGGLILFSVSNLITGLIADFIGRRTLLTITCIAFLVLIFPLYKMIVNHNTGPAITIYLVLSVFAGGAQGSFPCLLGDMFDTSVRYTAIAFCYNLAFAIFGGLTPLCTSIIMHKSPGTIAIGWILFIGAIITLLGITLSRVKRRALYLQPAHE